MTTFSITAEWLDAGHGAQEIRETMARLALAANSCIATRNENLWSRTVSDSVILAAYPLALWFASSWWRLRWEPSQETNRPSLSWKMAHQLSASGQGFIWPSLVLECDGESMECSCQPTSCSESEPVRYLNHFRTTIPVSKYEQGLDEFMSLVLARLQDTGIAQESDLQALWGEVLAERANRASYRHRQLEAILGFEPDEGPQALMAGVLALDHTAGEAAASEAAAACNGPEPLRRFQSIQELGAASGLSGRLDTSLAGIQPQRAQPPWQRGYELARKVRKHLALNDGPISDKTLTNLLALSSREWAGICSDTRRLPLGLGVRENGEVRLHFQKRNPQGQRFEAARFIADSLLAPQADRWLPLTAAKTARQKVQRSFAVELLCPMEELLAFLDADRSDDALEEASCHFNISSIAIRRHLENSSAPE